MGWVIFIGSAPPPLIQWALATVRPCMSSVSRSMSSIAIANDSVVHSAVSRVEVQCLKKKDKD